MKRFGCVEKLEKQSSEEDDDDDDDDDEARQECFLLEEVSMLYAAFLLSFFLNLDLP